MANIVGVLLAAGLGARYGRDKLSVQLPNGELVLMQSCRHLLAGVDRVLAVLRPGSETLEENLSALDIIIHRCDKAYLGMGASLSCAIQQTPEAGGWVVALADMPWIKPVTISRISQALRDGAQIVAPYYQGRRGHPVGFSQCFRDELMALTGDVGAKSILQKYGHQMVSIETEDAGILRDLDVPEDLMPFDNTLNP